MDDITKLIQDLKQQITKDYAEMNASVQRSIDMVDEILRLLNEQYHSDFNFQYASCKKLVVKFPDIQT